MMRVIVFLLLFPFTTEAVVAQCTTTDATDCWCPDSTAQCDLLPDISVSWFGLEDYMGGPDEYSQSGNGVNNGRLRFSASTPNSGHGPLTVRGSNYFVCGQDTLLGDPGVCPDGKAPKQLVVQRIYQKDGNLMSFRDVWAGAMTYHPTHGHNHVDHWGVFTLRLEDVNEPDPRNWPIVGEGTKLGFCLMDFGTCDGFNGHCRDDNTVYNQGSVLSNADHPNWGLGGGNYSCSPVEQGISSGYTDIYPENIDGQWINIPPGTCNGQYYIVAEVDPANNFIEEDETNNYTAIPITLSLQDPPGNPSCSIYPQGPTNLCTGQEVELRATGGFSFLWSTGDTTQSITVDQPGNYAVTVETYCGTSTSDTITITLNSPPPSPVISGDTICSGQSALLSATGSNVVWYNDAGFQVGSGSSFQTPSLTSSTTFYAEDLTVQSLDTVTAGPEDLGNYSVNYLTSDQYMIFDAMLPLRLHSVTVYANNAGNRTFTLIDESGNQVQTATFNLSAGENLVPLDFLIPQGQHHQLRVNSLPELSRIEDPTGLPYPYIVQDTISIHSSSSGQQHFYYFFNWKVSVGDNQCPSNPASFEVQVQNCLGLDDTPVSPTVELFPNPATDQLNVQLLIPGTAMADLSVFNAGGSMVIHRSEVFSSNEHVILNTADLPGGIYVLRLVLDEEIISRRFVIE